ncbi:MAG TPA: GNAT family N-acetyltransferase [Candidatus Hungatella pullicola]|nr:GNAT family N-acetyltransferase [Candidatus Hungatella pullicola]
MKVRRTEEKDIEIILNIYDKARRFMADNGNASQWVNGYPGRKEVEQDMSLNRSYVCVDQQDRPVGTFCFFQGEDPAYKVIEGSWKNSEPYGVVHRIASDGKGKGIATFCMNWCEAQCRNLRIDTHRKNIPMQNFLKGRGFQYCGIVYMADGTERLAFQKVNHHKQTP